jgi:DNA-binding XRE family transcriptional regulator
MKPSEIRAQRAYRKWSQADLAKAADVSPSSVWRAEKGHDVHRLVMRAIEGAFASSPVVDEPESTR